MPTYEYACRDCDEHVEVVQSFKDDPLEVCGACGGRLRKVFSAAGIIFKGSGFYLTDSRKAEAAASTSDSDTSKAESSKDASTTESGATSKDSGASKDSETSKGSGTSKDSGASKDSGSSSAESA